jgi:hypothetical protein
MSNRDIDSERIMKEAADIINFGEVEGMGNLKNILICSILRQRQDQQAGQISTTLLFNRIIVTYSMKRLKKRLEPRDKQRLQPLRREFYKRESATTNAEVEKWARAYGRGSVKALGKDRKG